MNTSILHPLNWQLGWTLILIGFVSGAAMGIFFHRESFLGGYTSFRRRLLRLGHIACVALGMLNVLFAVAVGDPAFSQLASVLLIIGAIAMPLICFLTSWKEPFRSLFFIPVVALISAVVLILTGGTP